MLPAKAQSSLCIYPVSQEHSLLKENVLIVYALNYYLYVNALWCLITKYFLCANREGSVQTSQMCRLVLTSPWCPRAIKQSKFRSYLECFQRRLRPACASIHFYKSIRYSCETSSLYMWATTWDFQQCGMCDQQRLRPACAYAQSDQSLCYSLEYSMSVKLLSEYHLEFLSSKGGYTGLSESAHVKMPHSWRSRVLAHVFNHVLYVNGQWSWSLVFTSLKLCLCDNEGFIEKVPMNNEFLIWTFAWCLLEPAYEIWVLISCSPSVRSKEPEHLSRLSRNCRICTEHKNTSQTNPRHQEEKTHATSKTISSPYAQRGVYQTGGKQR